MDEVGLEAWRDFLRAHAAVIAGIEGDLARKGLVPLIWYDVLVAIRSAPGGKLRMNALAGELVLTRSGATRLVDKLEKARLVRRTVAAEDRRGAVATLTPAGRRALSRAWPIYARGINERFLAQLTEGEIDALGRGLSRVWQSARRPTAQQAD